MLKRSLKPESFSLHRRYSYSLKNLHNRFMHLTNYSVNKRNADYESNSDEDICQGHKW